MRVRLLSQMVLALGAVISGAILLYAVDLSEPLLWLLSLVFLIWCVSPYWYLWRAVRRRAEEAPGHPLLLLTGIVVVVFALVIYVDGFFIHLDAQNGLLFLFIPLWQWVASGIMLTVLGRYSRWKFRD